VPIPILLVHATGIQPDVHSMPRLQEGRPQKNRESDRTMKEKEPHKCKCSQCDCGVDIFDSEQDVCDLCKEDRHSPNPPRVKS
jgi:hypothetical protein